jgi:hypothetical protein
VHAHRAFPPSPTACPCLRLAPSHLRATRITLPSTGPPLRLALSLSSSVSIYQHARR